MEIVYNDISITNDLLYKITKSGNDYKVIVCQLSTDEILDTNAYEGSLDDCIAFITIKIIK